MLVQILFYNQEEKSVGIRNVLLIFFHLLFVTKLNIYFINIIIVTLTFKRILKILYL